MPFPTNRGIKKVNERILTDGRAIIVTEKDSSKYDWSEIPNGSKFIDINTGIERVKLKDILVDKASGVTLGYGRFVDGKVFCQDGITPIYKPDGVTQYKETEVEFTEESSWVPANIKNDGTLCIARDSMIVEEVFTVEILDDGSGNMVYSNTEGNRRRFPKTASGGYVFELEYGPYIMGRNHLEVFLDKDKRYSAKSGGIEEITDRRFSVTEPLSVGQEILAKYTRWLRIGNPYPRIFVREEMPDPAEVADIWFDLDDYIDSEIGFTIDNYVTKHDSPKDSSVYTSPSGRGSIVANFYDEPFGLNLQPEDTEIMKDIE